MALTKNFSTEDKTVIAEFIFSYHEDILIKSDAISLIDVLEKHELIKPGIASISKDHVERQDKGISHRLFTTLPKLIPKKQLDQIMNEYYGGGN